MPIWDFDCKTCELSVTVYCPQEKLDEKNIDPNNMKCPECGSPDVVYCGYDAFDTSTTPQLVARIVDLEDRVSQLEKAEGSSEEDTRQKH